MSSVLFSLRKTDNMRAFLLLFLSEILLLRLTSATNMKVQRQNMRVRISAVGDTIVLKFIRPHVDTRLEGYILGYGSTMFSKQFIELPEDGQPYETEIDAEPKYLIAVQLKNPEEPKKKCAGKVDLDKPLNIVIGSVSETSVLLSWGTLLTSPFMDTVLEDCFDEGQFTVRYREKEPRNTWNYQTCPSTSTVIDNLKPDARYEFEVRADTDTKSGVWSLPVHHHTADQIIEQFPEPTQAKPKKPVLASQQTFLPTVPGEENPTTVPDNPPTSTEALPSSHTSIILPTPTTTSTVRPRNPTSHPSTTQADLLTEQHTSITPQQPTTSQPQPSRTQQQTSTTQQPTTTIQQYTSEMQISVKAQSNTAKLLLNTSPQHLGETSSPNPPTTKPPIQQTQQSTTSTVQEHPHSSKKQDSIHTRKFQPSTRLHRLSTTKNSRGTSKHPTTHTYFPETISHSSTIAHSEQPNTKPPPTTQDWSTNSHSLTNTALTSPTTLANSVLVTEQQTDVLVSQLKTEVSKHPVFSTNASILEEYSTSHVPTTKNPPLTENIHVLTPHTTYLPITFWYQPRPSTTKQQASTDKYNPKTDSQVVNRKSTPEEWLPGTPKNLLKLTTETAFTKSDAIQNSPVAERVTVGTRHPSRLAAISQPKELLSQPTLTNEVASRNEGRGMFRNSSSVSNLSARNATHRSRSHSRVPPVHHTKFSRTQSVYHNSTGNNKASGGKQHHRLLGSKFPKGTREQIENRKTNQASETLKNGNIIDLKQKDPVPDLKPLAPPTTERPAKQRPLSTTTPHSVFEGSRFDTGDNSSVFRSHPLSEVDATGKKRFIAPHVIYRTDKRPEEPCSVTRSLSAFPDEEIGYLNVTGPPKTPPTNLTVVTVEGCPSFIILDWDKSDNETTEYEVVSSTKGPDGKEVSVQTTNQTHTAVENLKPESSYEFKVTPKNELGSGPASEPVIFSTESADPRVSEIQTGKTAIWSSFPFKSDLYSECNGQQFIKRTWYRKFVGIQLCNSLRYKIYLSDSLKGKFYSIGDQTGYGEDHCQFVDSFLDGRTGGPLPANQLPPRQGYYRAMRQEPVKFGDIGGNSMINYVAWYECGIPIPGKW
ncbi:target of Nesh-SH3 isoform X1 [Carassius carassius]|uniref:target of Nesh-SH3 isoform X1 n=1 Tax=Carassius carassius TaxID=217509 RepID=UPI0028697DA2|nr:target of Nesh-SH3 isoform X1 [Carassius carassius]